MVKKASNPNVTYRSFTIEGSSIGYKGGEYVSPNPGQAARKMGTKLLRMLEKDATYQRFKHDDHVQFILREKTQGSTIKALAYKAEKLMLDKPVERKFPNPKNQAEPIIVKITHKTVVKALKAHEVHDSLKHHMA